MSGHRHIILTSHRRSGTAAPPEINWGAKDAESRGPLVGGTANGASRNVIGTHGGTYAIYRALAVSSGQLNADHVPDLTDTHPAAAIGPHPQWSDPEHIVSLDPFGHVAHVEFASLREAGLDIRPTIAVTQARLNLLEVREAMQAGRLKADGTVLQDNGDILVTKAAIDPVWYLPGMAKRFGVNEEEFRRGLFEQTAGMYPELVTRSDLSIFLPPIGGHTVYIVGDPAKLGDGKTPVACRVHDECNGSDVFGSDICTCRPYLMHGIEACTQMAQDGGVGVIVYNRKEGRSLGEVTKFLVYNARKRQQGGDTAANYFARTECVAGVQDVRFQELMPDVLHWLGIDRIDRFVSMSDMKHDALVGSGIRIVERVPIPDDLIPADASVEMEAKKAAGYYSASTPLTETDLTGVKGRELF